MAKSTSFYMDTTETTGAHYEERYFSVSATQTKNVSGNKSTIKWKLSAVGDSEWFDTGPTTLKIGGKRVYYKDRVGWGTGKFPAAQGSVEDTVEIEHDADGSKKILVELTTAVYVGSASAGTASKYWELEDIPRSATLTSAPHFSDSDNPTIGYSNPAGSAATVQACIADASGNTIIVPYRNVSSTGSSYTFNLTSSEREALIKAVPHGTNTVSVRFYIKTFINGERVGEFSYLTRTLTVKRAAVLTSAPNFNDENNPTITYSNPNGSTVSDIQVGIFKLDGATQLVRYRSISKTEGSYTFTLTEDERAALRSAIPAGYDHTDVRFYIKTYIDGNIVTDPDWLSKTFTVVNATPEIEWNLVDWGGVSTALTNDPNTIIKGFNYVYASMTPKLKKGATLALSSISNGSKKITTTEGPFENIENNNFEFSITDSYGTKVTIPGSIPMIPYVRLTCNIAAKDPSADGALTFRINGNYFNGKFGEKGVANELSLKWRIKENNDDYSEWYDITPTMGDTAYDITVVLTELPNGRKLDYRSSYVLQAIATDKINTYGVPSAEYLVKTNTVFNWGENNFDINVPLTVDTIECSSIFNSHGQLEWGSYDSNTGQKIDTSTGQYRNINPIEVEPNYGYIFYKNWGTQKYVVLFYDEHHNFISESRTVGDDGYFVTPSNAKYINFRCFQADFVYGYMFLDIKIKKASPVKALAQTTREVLYANSSGSNGTISLSKSISGFEYIEIYYYTSYNNSPYYKHYNSIKVEAASGTSCTLTGYDLACNTKTITHIYMDIEINDTYISCGNASQSNLYYKWKEGTFPEYGIGTTWTYITKVVGYK